MAAIKPSWRTWVVIMGALACPATLAHAQTPSAESKRLIYIEPGELATVLDQLASRTGHSITYDKKQIDGIQSGGARGTLSFDEALEMAVRGTGVVVRPGRDGSTAIKKPANRAPGGQAGTVDAETGDIIVTASSIFGATRGDTPLTEIPQSVQIMSSKQLDVQNSFSLTDALANATGITIGSSAANAPVYGSRGFRITNVHIDDGASIDNLSSATAQVAGAPDMGAYDHIEILRGADALFGGNGNPGASISLVRKEPLASDQMKIYLSAGSWNNFRGEVDANVVLTDDGRLRFRTDLVSASSDFFTDLTNMKLQNAFATLAFDLTDSTTLTVGGSIEHREGRDASAGLPRYPDGTDAGLPRSLGITFPWSFYEADTKEAFAKFTQDIGESWNLKGGLTWRKRTSENLQAQFLNSAINPDTLGLYGNPTISYTIDPAVSKQLAMDLTLTGSWRFLDVPIDTLLGIDHQNFKSTSNNGFLQNYNYRIDDIFAFDPDSLANPFNSPNPLQNAQYGQDSLTSNTQSSTGIYGSMRVHLTNRLAIVGGGRWNRQSVDSRLEGKMKALIPLPGGVFLPFEQTLVTDPPKITDRKFTPFGGAVFNIDGTTSIYVSYSEIYATNGGKMDRDFNALPPLSGVNKEAGIKKMWNNGRLVGSLAIFDIKQKNIVFPDLTAPPTGNPLCCFILDGENTSWGVEAELNGTIAPGWDFSAGYTFNKNKALFGNVLGTFTPKHLFKLWTSYRLPGKLDRFTIGGNFSFQSSNFVTGTYAISQFCNGAVTPFCGDGSPVYTFRNVQKPYATLDLRIAFDITKQFNLAATVNNVTDTRYFATVGAPYAGSAYGTPRNVLFKLTSTF